MLIIDCPHKIIMDLNISDLISVLAVHIGNIV